MKKYYFIVSRWRKIKEQDYHIGNDVIDHNPLKWLMDCQAYKDEIHELLFYSEITEEEFKEYDGCFS